MNQANDDRCKTVQVDLFNDHTDELFEAWRIGFAKLNERWRRRVFKQTIAALCGADSHDDRSESE